MAIAILLDVPPSFIKEAQYCFENILFPYDYELIFVYNVEDINLHRKVIVYCHEDSWILKKNDISSDTVFIVLENRSLSYFASFQAYDLENLIWIKNIPCLFPNRNPDAKAKSIHIFPFDIVAAAFFFIACWQEYFIGERDDWGRIPLKSTIQHKLNIIRRPIVNEYLEIFVEHVQGVWNGKLRTRKLPGGSDSFIALSHDVDHIDWAPDKYLKYLYSYRRSIAINAGTIVSVLRNLIGKKYIFDKIIGIEKKYQANSTFFFFGNYENKYHQKYAEGLIDSLDKDSFEIGFHLSPDTIQNNQIADDFTVFDSIQRYPIGARVHTLKFDVYSLYCLLEKSGFKYDSSLLFAEDMGYRTGFTYPHYIFDPNNRRPFDVVAIPLNIMDGTLFDSKYMGLSEFCAESEIISFIEKNIRYGGAISILFHNNMFFLNTRKRLATYDRMLMYSFKRNIRLGTCSDLYHWRNNNSKG